MPRSAAVAAYLISMSVALYAAVKNGSSRTCYWGSGILHTLIGLAWLSPHGDLALRALSAGAFVAAALYARRRTNARLARCAAPPSSSASPSSHPAAAT